MHFCQLCRLCSYLQWSKWLCQRGQGPQCQGCSHWSNAWPKGYNRLTSRIINAQPRKIYFLFLPEQLREIALLVVCLYGIEFEPVEYYAEALFVLFPLHRPFFIYSAKQKKIKLERFVIIYSLACGACANAYLYMIPFPPPLPPCSGLQDAFIEQAPRILGKPEWHSRLMMGFHRL